MKNIIVGTSGHIDHGKTALVRALTGVDTDRLEEEKRRGITIDLGFAPLQLTPELRTGFIDVPGHERFVRNMVAGVSGIDLVLLVIAADESIKPQTREHFDICRLLGIRRGLIALTKADLADREIAELARLEVEELVAGSFLEGSPIVPVSAVTGEGIDKLKSELIAAAQGVKVKDSARHMRLPIDRAFSMKGFGTVVTGTLISGSIEPEQEVEIHPTGKRVRVRGVQVYGQPAQRASAGERTALNLADVDRADLARGMTLATPGIFESTRMCDCSIELLSSATPLKNGAPVHFHSGSAEIEAEVRLFDSLAIRPGGAALARIVLREPALLAPGDRFILRRFSPVVTIGGGVVLDSAGPKYRNRAAGAARLRDIAASDEAGFVEILIRESAWGISLSALIARTGSTASEIESFVRGRDVITLTHHEPWFVGAAWFRSAQDDLVERVRKFHQSNPLAPGVTKGDLRGNLPAHVLDALLAAEKEIVADGDIVRLSTHKVVLREEEERAREIIERTFEKAGLAVPAVAEALAQSGVEPRRARAILQILIRETKLVRINEELVLHHSSIRRLKELLAAHRGERFAVTVFKEWTGISRKYAIPLLEYLDRERVTRREGDERVVL